MDAKLEQKARELLAAELDAIRFPAMAAEIRDTEGYNTLGAAMVRVVSRALTQQGGGVEGASDPMTVLDLLRTDSNGKKWNCIASRAGTWVDVSQMFVSGAEPSAQVEYRLWDSQWVNVVNHDRAYADWEQEAAIHHAVKLTEQAMAKNVREGKWPKPKDRATTPTPEATRSGEGVNIRIEEVTAADLDVLKDAWASICCDQAFIGEPDEIQRLVYLGLLDGNYRRFTMTNAGRTAIYTRAALAASRGDGGGG